MQRITSLRAIAVLALFAFGACDTVQTPTAADPTGIRPLGALAMTSMTVTNSSGHPLVSWSPVPEAVSYTVSLITYSSNTGDGTYQNRYFTTLATTAGTSYLDTDNSYTGMYECTYSDPWGNPRGAAYEYGVTSHFANGTSLSRHYASIAQPGCGME